MLENRYPAYDTTRSRLGKGQIAAIYGPVGVAYAAAHAAPAREFIGKVLGSIFTPDLTLDAPPSVEAVLRRKGMQVAAEYAVIDSIPAVGPIGISLRLPARPSKVTREPGAGGVGRMAGRGLAGHGGAVGAPLDPGLYALGYAGETL